METLPKMMFLVLIPAQYLHAVLQIGSAIPTKSVLDRIQISRGEAAPISHGNPLTVHSSVLVSNAQI